MSAVKIGKQKRNRLILSLVTYGLVIVAYLLCQTAVNQGWSWMTPVLKGQLINICVWITMAVSLNLVVGISGELSLGHAGFMSIGAFTAVMIAKWMRDGLSVESEWVRLLVSMLSAGCVAGIFGAIIGIPVLRLRGDYLAIVTLAFGEIIRSIMNVLYAAVDGQSLRIAIKMGKTPLKDLKPFIKGAQGAGKYPMDSTFLAGFLLVMFTLIIVLNLVNSRSGRAIMAVRDTRIAAEAMGINPTKYKMMAFVTAAFLAGMAGALYALGSTGVEARQFDYNTSINVLVYVVLGGIGNILGSVISATALTILPEMLRAFNEWRMLIYAVVLILVMLLTNSAYIRSFVAKLHKKDENAEGGKAHE